MTVEQHLQQVIGSLVIQLADAHAKNDQLIEQLKALSEPPKAE